MNITEWHALDRRRRLRDSLARSASYRPLAVRIALANADEAERAYERDMVPLGVPADPYELEPYGGVTRTEEV